jgi:hypothetical protein
VSARKRLVVIPPGATVGVRVPKIKDAVVLEVHVGPSFAVSYQLAWWVEDERYTDRFEAFEVDADPEDVVSIGFRGKG